MSNGVVEPCLTLLTGRANFRGLRQRLEKAASGPGMVRPEAAFLFVPPDRSQRMKSNTLALISIAIVISLMLPPCRSIAATPVPNATGPIPVTATSYPFGAADHTMLPQNLKSLGYIEEEFLISGTANVYDWPGPGPASVSVANAPYTTRVLVRRPVSRYRGK